MTEKIDVFSFVKAIQKGKNLFAQEDDPALIKAYVPFMVNRALSYAPDCIFYANDMNMYPNLPPRMQHDYLNNCIGSAERTFSPWGKPDKSEEVLLVSEYFNCSLPRARESLELLTEDDLKVIRDKMSRGGLANGKREKG